LVTVTKYNYCLKKSTTGYTERNKQCAHY